MPKLHRAMRIQNALNSDKCNVREIKPLGEAGLTRRQRPYWRHAVEVAPQTGAPDAPQEQAGASYHSWHCCPRAVVSMVTASPGVTPPSAGGMSPCCLSAGEGGVGVVSRAFRGGIVLTIDHFSNTLTAQKKVNCQMQKYKILDISTHQDITLKI